MEPLQRFDPPSHLDAAIWGGQRGRRPAICARLELRLAVTRWVAGSIRAGGATHATRAQVGRSGVGKDLAESTLVAGEVPRVDQRRLEPQVGQRGTDLAAMVRSMVDDLGDANAE